MRSFGYIDRLYVTQVDQFNASGVETPGVVAIDIQTRAVATTISVTAANANKPNDSTTLFYPAITPDGKYLYVPVHDYGTGTYHYGNTVAVISTEGTGKTIDQIPVGNGPVQVAIAPNGFRAYVTNSVDNTVSVINITGG